MTEKDNHATQLHVLETITTHLTTQMSELVVLHRDLAKQTSNSDTRMARIEKKLDENTDITEGVRDVLTAGKVATQVLKWLGVVGGAMAGIWAAVLAFNGGHGPRP